MKERKKIHWEIQGGEINHKTLSEQIADSIERTIFEYKDDFQRLPSEMDLCEKYKASRTVIREALKILKERGLVSGRAGDGSYATIPAGKTISGVMNRIAQFNDISDEKITEVRIILEVKAASKAAENATEADIGKLEEIVRQTELCKNDIPERALKDCEFHIAVARISGNEMLAFMLESLLEILKKFIEKRLETNPRGNEHGFF